MNASSSSSSISLLPPLLPDDLNKPNKPNKLNKLNKLNNKDKISKIKTYGLVGFMLGVVWVGGGVLLQPTQTVMAQAQPSPNKAKPTLTISMVQPKQAPLPQTISTQGPLSAWQETSISAQVQGLQIAQIKVQVGDSVRKGQVLAELSGAAIAAEVAQSKAALTSAKAAWDNAKAEWMRAQSIADSGVLSKSQLQQLQTQEKVTNAQFEAAKAALAQAQLRLGHTQILAPDSGIISARMATVGSVVGIGQELFRLIRQGRLEWRAEITPAEVGNIKPNTLAILHAATGATIQGRVRTIAPVADAQSRNIAVYVDLPPHPDLKAGLYAKGELQLGETIAMTIPALSVIHRDGFAYVFVVSKPVAGEAKVARRKISIGRRVQDRVEVISGLTLQEAVAVQGAGFLSDGDTVRLEKSQGAGS